MTLQSGETRRVRPRAPRWHRQPAHRRRSRRAPGSTRGSRSSATSCGAARPTAFDRVLATRFGIAAIDAVHEGDFGTMVALHGDRDRPGADRRRGPRAQDRRPELLTSREHLLRVARLQRPAVPDETALDDLIALLELEPLEVNLFRGVSPDEDRQRVFGGQVAAPGARRRGPHRRARPARALAARVLPAARRSRRPDRLRGRPHPRREELHDPPGRRDPARPGDLQPRRRRSRSTRPGPDHAMDRCPTCPARGRCRRSRSGSSRTSTGSGPRCVDWLERERPIDPRPIDDPPAGSSPAPRAPRQDVWIKANGMLPDDPLLHVCVVVVRVRPHDPRHRDAPARDRPRRTSTRWRASTTRCGSTDRSAPTSGCCTTRSARRRPARGASREGSIFRATAALAVTVIQEGLMRPIRRPAARR